MYVVIDNKAGGGGVGTSPIATTVTVTLTPILDPRITDSELLATVDVGQTVTLDASTTPNRSGQITSEGYLWDLDGGFAGCFLVKKAVSGHEFVSTGAWDSIHVVEVNLEEGGKAALYKLTTTVILTMDVQKESVGDTNLSGTLTRTAEKRSVIDAEHTHMHNMGTLIEDTETDIRVNMDALYIQKTREVVNNVRQPQAGPSQGAAFTASLNEAVKRHAR